MRHIKPIVWLIFILSGASSLIYEVIWMRQLTLVFGSTVFATSTVLTAFMAGLALGSFYFGRKIDESNMSPLKLYAFLEAGIGGFCLIWPLLLSLLSAVYVLVYRNITSEFYTLSLIRFILTFGVLLIPATLMGGTLPVLTRFFVKRLEHLGTNVGILYALNTFGAVIGTVAAGFFLIEALGIRNTIFVGVAINFAVAFVSVLLDRLEVQDTTQETEEPPEQEAAPPPQPTQSIPLQRLILLATGISGFCALGYEVLWTRILVFFLGSTTYAFATMLAAFLFGIALGSLIFARWVDRMKRAKRAVGILGILQLGIGLSALLLMPAFEEMYGMGKAFENVFGGGRFWAFFSCFIVMSVPTFLMGASFPLVTKIYTGSARQLGRSIGNVYAINTVGSILGAFCAGFILLPLIGIRPSIGLMVVLNTSIGCLLIFKLGSLGLQSAAYNGVGIGMPILNVGLAVILLLTLNKPLFLKSAIFQTQRPGDTLIDYNEEVDATVTTLKDDEGVYRLYVDTNQAADASRWDSPSHRVIAHLPLLLHPDPRRALVVGFGMGLTSYSITQHGVQVEAVELSRGVISAARKHFTHVNGNVFEKKNLFNYTINDGRNHILMTKTKYDMISTGIIHPLVSAGSSNIYTADFYRLCRRILTEDGVMCQWVPLHRLPETHYKMIVRTFIEVFPETTLWYKYTPDFVILIGTSKPLTINYKNFIERAQLVESIREGLAADDLDGMSLLDSFMMGPEAVREYAGVGPIHTDNRPRLEFFRGAALVKTTAQNIQGMKQYREKVMSYLTNYGTTLAEKKAVREGIDRYFEATQQLILGQIAYANRQLENAATLIQDAVRRNPWDETIRYNFSVVAGLIHEGDQEELRRAEEQLKRRLAQNPDDVMAHLELGITYRLLDKLKEAASEFEEVLKRSPNRLEVYMLLGPIYEIQGQDEEALHTYERLERLDPDLPAPIFEAMAEVHLRVGNNVDAAKKYALKGIKKGETTGQPSWRSHLTLGKVYAILNQPQKQREHYTNALKILDEAISRTADNNVLGELRENRQQIQTELEQLEK